MILTCVSDIFHAAAATTNPSVPTLARSGRVSGGPAGEGTFLAGGRSRLHLRENVGRHATHVVYVVQTHRELAKRPWSQLEKNTKK